MIAWETAKIGEIGVVFDGPHATPKTIDEGPLFLGIPSLNSGRLDLTSTRHVSEDDFRKWTKRVEPRAGDFVFSYETKIGEAALIPEGLRCCLGRRMGLVRLDRTRCDSKYFLYQYLSPRYQEFLASRTVHGATVDRLLLKEFPDFQFPLPPLDEQKSMASILGALDDKIELNRRMSATLEEMALTLYRSWFVDFDPVHARAKGDPPAHMDPATAALFPDSFGDDGLPEGWGVVELGQYCVQAKTTVKPMQQAEQLFQHFSLPAYDTGQEAPFEAGASIKSNKVLVPENAILFSRLNPRIPRVWWAKTTTDKAIPVCSTEFFVAQAGTSNAVPHLYCLLSSGEFLEAALARVGGTSGSHQRVSPDSLKGIETVLPPTSVIVAFGENTFDWFNKIHLMTKENANLANLRDTLLPRLMSGELRIREAEEQVEAVV